MPNLYLYLIYFSKFIIMSDGSKHFDYSSSREVCSLGKRQFSLNQSTIKLLLYESGRKTLSKFQRPETGRASAWVLTLTLAGALCEDL